MRKKKVLEQNLILFKELSDAKAEIKELKAELKRLENIKREEKIIEEKQISEPLKELEKKMQNQIPALSDDLQFASEIIGKIVIESARYSNMLTADGETRYKELVNLILGRTEVAKAEILTITKEDISLEKKKEKIISVKNNAVEYFEVVMAQKQ